MMRILLILYLVVLGTMQGFARGNIDVLEISTQHTATAVVSSAASNDLEANATAEKCCDETAKLDNKPSLCKSDCKALVPLTIGCNACAVARPDFAHSPSLTYNLSRFMLRPPIS